MSKRTKVTPAEVEEAPEWDTIEIDGKTLRYRYEDLLPPLDEDKRDALQADIRRDGITDPIKVHATEEEDTYDILDGNNRLRLVERMRMPQEERDEIPVLVRSGMSDAEQVMYAIQKNEARRTSIARHPARRRKYVQRIRELDGRKSLRQIAEALGVSHETVRVDLKAIEAEDADLPPTERERLQTVRNRWHATFGQAGAIRRLFEEGDDDRNFDPSDLGWSDDDLEDFRAKLAAVQQYAEASRNQIDDKLRPDEEE